MRNVEGVPILDHSHVRCCQRQASHRGKAFAAASFHSVPMLQLIPPRVALGPSQAHVAGGCAARGTQWQAAMTWPPSWRTEAP